jgi:hypothetical protein
VTPRAKRIVAFVFILGPCVAALACVSSSFWCGSCGYNQLEYELTFKDLNGKPIEGVELSIEDERGNEFFCFPVTDYSPAQKPKSDEHGEMRFHHVSTAVEWDNCGWTLFWVDIPASRSFAYICRFLYRGKEVHRVAFGELPRWDWKGTWEEVPKVRRRFNWSTMLPLEIIPKRPYEHEEVYDSTLRHFFHVDDKHREGCIARRNVCRLLNKVDEAHRHKKEPVEDIDFPVIRRTITIDLPSDEG